MIEGLTFVRQLFKELGEELLSFSSDEVEVRWKTRALLCPPILLFTF